MRLLHTLYSLLLAMVSLLAQRQPPLPRVIKHSLHPFMKRCYGKVLAGGRGLSMRFMPLAARAAVVVAILLVGAFFLAHPATADPGTLLAFPVAVLPQLIEKRTGVVDRMEAMVEASEAEDRDFSAEEKAEWESLKEQRAQLDARIANAREVESARAAAAANALPPVGRNQTVNEPAARGRSESPEAGLAIGRLVREISASGGRIDHAVDALNRQADAGDTIAQRALAAGEATAGGFWVSAETDDEIIELLRPASVIRQLNPTIMPMDSGILRLPKLTGGASAGYIGENRNVGKTEQTAGLVELSAKKLAALVPISNDLIRRPSRRSDQVVRDDLFASLGQRSDLAFIRGDGTGAGPRGLRHQATGDNVISANATVNLANVTTDLSRLVLALEDGNVRMLRPGWVFSPRTKQYLMTVRDGNGNYAFRDEMLTGTLWGMPFKSTTQVPSNLGAGGDESEIYIADFADVVIGETQGILISVSDQAAYHDGSAVVAAFSLDQTVIRAIMEHDLAMRHEESVAVLTTVTWGA